MARFKTSFSDGFTDRDTSKIAARNLAEQLDNLAGNAAVTKDGKTDRSFAQQLRIVLQDTFPRKKYTVNPGDTAETIAAAAGISVDVLYYLNPQLGENEPLPGDEILLPYTSPIGTLSDEDTSGLTDRFNSVFADDTKTTEEIATAKQNTLANSSTNSGPQNTANGTATNAVMNPQANAGTEINTENKTTVTETVAVPVETKTNVAPDQTVAQPQLPADRSDIKIWTELTATQKTTYLWSEVLPLFKAAQPKVGSYELNAWTRKQLRDGWNFGDEIPLLYKARQVASLGGIPVIEAYSFNDAWNFAETLGLPKNTDAPFYWQTKFAGKRHLYYLNYSSNEQWQNYVNNHEHLDTVDYDLLLETAGNSAEDKLLYDKIKRIPHPNDQLLSMEFLLLTSHAQRAVYTHFNDPLIEEKSNGVYSPGFYSEMYTWKTYRTNDAIKEVTENKQMQWAGLPDVYDSTLYHYQRDGVKFSLVQSKLVELRSKIAACPGTVSYDALESYVTENFPVPQEGHENEKYFKVLNNGSRITLLEAYLKEWWLDNSQELIVNGIIRSTPMELMQREQLNTWLRKNEKAKYNEIKENINESTANKRSFFDATEIASVTKPGMAPILDDTFITKGKDDGKFRTPWENIETMGLMSKGMIESLTYGEFVVMMGYIEDYQNYVDEDEDTEVAVPDAEFDKLDFFIITWSQKNPLKAGEYFSADNFEEMLRLKTEMKEATFNKIRDEAFESAFKSNPAVYNSIIPVIYNPPAETFEDITSGLPGSLIRDLSQYEQIEIIYQLMNNFGSVGGESQKTINRILVNAGNKNLLEGEQAPTPETIEARRLEFYNALTTGTKKMTEDDFEWSFTGYDESLAIQQLRDMKNMPTSDQMKSVTDAGYFGKDEAINNMTPKAMRELTFETRQEYVQILLGKTMAEEPYNKLFTRFCYFTPALAAAAPQNWTRVGESDEESLLLLVKTCPPDESDKLMDFIKLDGGNIYYALDAAIHGEQYKRLHDEVAVVTEGMIMGEQYEHDKAGNIVRDINGLPVETETHKKNKAERDQLQTDMDRQGLAHPNVVPWSDPGLLKQLFAGATVFEYHLSFTAENKVRLHYNISNAWASSTPSLSALIGTATSNTKEFDAGERIGVLFLNDDLALGANRGEVRMMPAINLFYLENKQTNRQIGEVVDVAVIAISVATLLTPAAPLFEVVLAVGDLAYSLLHLVTESFKENLSEELRESLEEVEHALMTAQLAGAGIMAAKLLRSAAAKLLAKITGTTLSKDAVTILKGKIAQAESEARLLEQLETATKAELERFLSDLERMGAKTDEGFAAFYKARLKEQIARATGDERLIAQALKEQEAFAAKGQAQLAARADNAGTATTTNGATITRNRYNGVDVTVPGANGKPQRLQVNIENGEMHFVPVDPADAGALALVDDELRWKTYEKMTANDQALVKNKPVNPKVKVIDPEAPKVEVPKEAEVKPGVLSDAQLREIMDEAYINHGAITWSDDAAEAFLAKRNARAMYMPSQPGKPGTLIFSKSATPAEVAEEMLHLQQHKSLRFAKLTTAQFIDMELEAQRELIAYARRSGMDADAALFEENLAYWQKQKTQLEMGGDAARMVENEVDGFKMVDDPGNYHSPTEEELETIVVEQFQNDKPLDVIANSSIYGSKGLQGDTFIYDLVGIYSIDKTNLNVNLFAVLSEISKQAIELKAKRIVINGYAVINDDFNKFFNIAKRRGGSALGWEIKGDATKGKNVVLTKEL